MIETNPCPICEQSELKPYYICRVCGWENDIYQLECPDEEGHANGISLNEAKRMWNNGEGFESDYPHPNQMKG